MHMLIAMMFFSENGHLKMRFSFVFTRHSILLWNHVSNLLLVGWKKGPLPRPTQGPVLSKIGPIVSLYGRALAIENWHYSLPAHCRCYWQSWLRKIPARQELWSGMHCQWRTQSTICWAEVAFWISPIVTRPTLCVMMIIIGSCAEESNYGSSWCGGWGSRHTCFL